jgi:hypothetical protein
MVTTNQVRSVVQKTEHDGIFEHPWWFFLDEVFLM